jgi:hypothetical protein
VTPSLLKMPTLLKNIVLLGVGPADVAGSEWEVLRRLLLGDRPTSLGDLDALVAAVKNGEVVTLAAAADSDLAANLSRDVRRQALVDGCLELALSRAAAAFERKGIDECCLLKGSATSLMLYEASVLRVRRDVDVLVSETQFRRAIQALADDGWEPDVSAMAQMQGPAHSRDWSMTLELPIGRISCDLHQRLFPGDRFRVDHAGILSRATCGAFPLAVPALEDLFLHTALHIARNAFLEPYKAWWDLVLLTRAPGFSWEALAKRAEAWRGKTALWATLTVLERWFRIAVPAKTQRALQPGRARRRVIQHLLSGDGGFPLRHHVRRLAATAVFAPLLADDAESLANYIVEVGQRRFEAAASR